MTFGFAKLTLFEEQIETQIIAMAMNPSENSMSTMQLRMCIANPGQKCLVASIHMIEIPENRK